MSCSPKSRDSYHVITPIYIDICPPVYICWKVTKPAGKSQPKIYAFSYLLLLHGRKMSLFCGVQCQWCQKDYLKYCSGKYTKLFDPQSFTFVLKALLPGQIFLLGQSLSCLHFQLTHMLSKGVYLLNTTPFHWCEFLRKLSPLYSTETYTRTRSLINVIS